MKINILKKAALLASISATLFANDISMQRVGGHLGWQDTYHSQKTAKGTVTVSNEANTHFKALEIYTTLNGVFEREDLKPYLSYTHSFMNDEISHTYILAGVNKYYQQNSEYTLYAGVLGGFGIVDWNYNPMSDTTDNKHASNSLNIGLQGGMEYPLEDKLSLSLNIKYLLHQYDTKLQPNANNEATITHDKTLFFGVGLVYNFDTVKKQKPIKEEPKDGDQDGVVDAQDQCPSTPAGYPVDAQGCVLDSDGDGIIDPKDQCLKTPANYPVDEKGCTLDSDNDGVIDPLDQCPQTPPQTEVNATGCVKDAQAAQIAQAVASGGDLSYTFDVQFDSGKAILKDQYKEGFDKFVRVMNVHTEYDIEVQGYTDDRGAKNYNQRLSEQRANSVMNYLIEAGLDADRLTAVGYGIENPVADNETPEGREANRRVEAKLTKKEAPKHSEEKSVEQEEQLKTQTAE